MSLEQLEKIFSEWAKRYSENPKGFNNILDSEGKPAKNYGHACAMYFKQLDTELN